MSRIWLINQYATTPATGMGGRHHYLAKELATRGHQVTVIAARRHHLVRDDIDTAELPSEEIVDGYRFVRLNVPRYAFAHDKRRILAWIAFALKLPGLGRQLGSMPDTVLYSSPQLLGYLGAERLARRCGAKLVFEVRDIWPLTFVEVGKYNKSHPFIRFSQWIEDRAYANADRIVSNLSGAIEHIASRGAKREKFCWIPNGISLPEVDNPELLPTTFFSQVPSNGFRVVYTGSLGKANALKTLLDAAVLLKDLPVINFLLVGNGGTRRQLEEQRDLLHLTNVFFLGSVKKQQVQSVLRSCDICYIGLTSDPLFRFGVSPNKLFDYFASSKPVIYAIDSGNFRPVQQYLAGLHVPAENAMALADAIRKLYLMSEKDRNQMGQNGRNAVIEHYDYAKLALKLETVLLSQ